jgi:hypothetical protein
MLDFAGVAYTSLRYDQQIRRQYQLPQSTKLSLSSGADRAST